MKAGALKQDSPFTIQVKFWTIILNYSSCPELLDRYMLLPMLTELRTWLFAASHIYWKHYIKLLGFPTKSNAEWGDVFLICRYILNYYMVYSCF